MKPIVYLASLVIACLAASAVTTEERQPAPTRQPVVWVLGAVSKPGIVPMPSASGEQRFTIVDAIACAGGPTRLAELRAVKVTRKVTIEVDVQQMMKSRNPSTYLSLQAGDTIHIPLRP